MAELSNEDRILKCMAQLQSSLVADVKSNSLINGPNYIRRNKLLALLHLRKNDDLEAIFHLTESHSPTLRNMLLRALQTYKQNKSLNEKFSDALPSELETDYFAFNGSYFDNRYTGVLNRLKEMPKEWTIVQLTIRYDENFRMCGMPKDYIPEDLRIHITRLPCGQLTEEGDLLTVLTERPRGGHSDNMASLLKLMNESIKKITVQGNIKHKYKMRKEAASDMKSISGEVITAWIKEWSCLISGTLCDNELQDLIKSVVDDAILSVKNKNKPEMNKKELSTLYQIASCCAHLTENDIKNAVKYCVNDINSELFNVIVSKICEFKNGYSRTLMMARRNPVLLILDELLECIPWEMTTVLVRHPVSRIPSLHFAHALYNKHKDAIVKGNRIIKSSDVAFYIINPESDLDATEKKLLQFFRKRLPLWSGTSGEKPSADLFIKSLISYNTFVYSGHGNGARYLNPEDVYKQNIDSVPLLFGCSSVAKQHFGEGGRPEMIGISDQFLVAGCPCVIGMLWPVTSTDTDLITMMLLNMSMAGSPININDVIGSEEIESDKVYDKENELLRVLKPVRAIAKLYTNGAAIVARGIPIEFED
ncbi:extra spindle pole bodies like 1, separase [Lycorma delicatula]|uniref:extra spindle pole bodies like 1, separase n=1 Tax=Lycorma delicatula TaxID=130591 RepID=UPI003F50E80C